MIRFDWGMKLGRFFVLRRCVGLCRSGAVLLKCRRLCSFGKSGAMSSPWLMMPPVSDESGKVAFKFHSLGNKELITCDKLEFPVPNKLDNVYFPGSSHGWLFVHNWTTRDLFMLNPITGAHHNLPPVEAEGGVSRVALSCSPDEEENCRAMIVYGRATARKLAFCVPGRSKEWTRIGGESNKYENVVYSSAHELFFCITKDPTHVEGWDVTDPVRPRIDWMLRNNEHLLFDNRYFPWPSRSPCETMRKQECWRIKYILVHGHHLFLVVRHVDPRLREYDDNHKQRRVKALYISKYRGWDTFRYYVTFDFDVYRIDLRDSGEGDVMLMTSSLEGLSMFVGNNHSFAMSSPEFKANCIYYSDENGLMRRSQSFVSATFGGHDNGIFDCQNNTFTSCCGGCPLKPLSCDDIKRIEPPPLCLRYLLLMYGLCLLDSWTRSAYILQKAWKDLETA